MKEEMFSKGKVGRVIFKLSIPLVISQIINVLYNIVDRIYIGNLPNIGQEALAGVGIAFPIIIIVSAFASLVGAGGAPIAAIKMGEGQDEEAKKIMMNSFMMLIIMGILLTIALLLFNEKLLYLFGATDELIEYGKSYLNIYALGSISVMLTLGLNSYITAQGYTNIAMIVVLIGAVLNIILDPILMFTLNMGVKGAAYATVISQTVSAIFVLIFLSGKRLALRLEPKSLKLDSKIILSILALGISPFIMQATESLVQITFNIQITKYGGTEYKTYLNIMTIMLSIMQFIMLPIFGLSQGASPLISYNFGAKNIDRVKSAFKIVLITSLSYTLIFYLLIFLFPKGFVLIFNNDPLLLEIAPRILRIFFIGMSIMGIQIACQNTFLALGQAKISVILALLRKIILLIPITLILPIFMGINGVFYSEAIADVIAVVTTSIVFMILFGKILDNRLDTPN